MVILKNFAAGFAPQRHVKKLAFFALDNRFNLRSYLIKNYFTNRVLHLTPNSGAYLYRYYTKKSAGYAHLIEFLTHD